MNNIKAAEYSAAFLYHNTWWRRRGSNSRPYGCEPYALPAELRPHYIKYLTPAGAKLQVYF